MHITTQKDIDIINQHTREQYIRVEILDHSYKILQEIDGVLTGGSVNINADSDLRRTANVNFVVREDMFNVFRREHEWMSRYLRIKVGILHNKTKEIVWYNQGIYVINNPSLSLDAQTNTISFEALDLMSLLTGRRNGYMPQIQTIIPVGTKVATIVKSMVENFTPFKNTAIVDRGLTVPYDMKFEAQATVYQVLNEIRNLYADWEFFFDEEGVFRFQPIPKGAEDFPAINFDELRNKQVISYTKNVNFENIKNHIIVWGRLLDDGTQVKGEARETNADSAFSIQNLKQDILYIVEDERIYNNQLAQERALYELYLHCQLNDGLNLVFPPVYWLNQPNRKIVFNGENYIIKSISMPLNVGETMNIGVSKIYKDYSI